jgi:hypothetical protein
LAIHSSDRKWFQHIGSHGPVQGAIGLLASVGDGEAAEIEGAAHVAVFQDEELGIHGGFQEWSAE